MSTTTTGANDDSNNNDWEELFALAQGSGRIRQPNEQDRNSDDRRHRHHDEEEPLAPPRKRARTPAGTPTTSHYSSDAESYLEARCHPEPVRLDDDACFFRLSRSFAVVSNNNDNNNNNNSPICKRWKEQQQHQSPQKHSKRRCKRCQGLPGEHVLKLVNDETDHHQHHDTTSGNTWILTSFSILRNIRCWSRLYILFHRSKTTAAVLSVQPLQNWIESLASQGATMQQGGSISQLLKEKCRLLETAARALRKIAAASATTTITSQQRLQAGIRCMIACDQLYYQLYYRCITAGTFNNTIEPTPATIPHPVSYFGEWAVQDASAAADFVKTVRAERDSSQTSRDFDELLQSHFGFLCSDRQNGQPDSINDHALSALHRLRRNETIALFRGWKPQDFATAAAAPTATTKTLLEERHATLAPAILQEWRDDSCRDFVCHLYGYATVSNSTLLELQERLINNHGTTSIVEVGAGTGYMAYLLQQQQQQDQTLSVYAYDVAPATTANEYHAATPLFAPVHAGTATNYLQKLPKHSVRNNNEPFALLLCYPPPDHPMASQALRRYVQHCDQRQIPVQSQIVIYIGEFKGLTGSAQFEAELVQQFQCLRRWPCQTWGTDASQVTLWQRKQRRNDSNEQDKNSLLLPCSHCRTRESKRRCRWMRSLCYCSRACCAAHCATRRRLLAVALVVGSEQGDIPAGVDDLDNDEHYSAL